MKDSWITDNRVRRKKKTFAQIVIEGNENKKFNSVERNIEPEKNASFTIEDMVVNPMVKSKDDINFADIYKNLLDTEQNSSSQVFLSPPKICAGSSSSDNATNSNCCRRNTFSE